LPKIKPSIWKEGWKNPSKLLTRLQATTYTKRRLNSRETLVQKWEGVSRGLLHQVRTNIQRRNGPRGAPFRDEYGLGADDTPKNINGKKKILDWGQKTIYANRSSGGALRDIKLLSGKKAEKNRSNELG